MYLLQHVEGDDALAESPRPRRFQVEPIEEVHRPLRRRRRPVVGRSSAGRRRRRVARRPSRRSRPTVVDENIEPAGTGRIRGQERMAADASWDAASDPAAAVAELQVLAGGQAEQGDRRHLLPAALVVAPGGHEEQRRLETGLRKFGGGDEHRVLVGGNGEIGERRDPAVAMQRRIEPHRAPVQGRRNRAHDVLPCRSTRSPASALASTLSTRLPSRSTTSKRQPFHSTESAVSGRRPSSSMIIPASVL